MDFLDMFLTALMPVLKVLLITALGAILATKRINILEPKARHHLNNMAFYIFFPALIGRSLADSITPKILINLWFMPVNIFFTFMIGSLLAWILNKIIRTPRNLRSLVIGCCSAGNLGSMLLIILPTICEESDTLFGDSSTCSTYGETYASLSLAIQAIYVWSVLYFIMRASANNERKELDSSNSSTVIINIPDETPEVSSETEGESSPSSNDRTSSEDHSDQAEITDETRTEAKTKAFVDWIKTRAMIYTEKLNLKMVFSPSMNAAIVGFIIGIVPPFRKTMIGKNAPLRVIYSSAQLLGATRWRLPYESLPKWEAAIPSVTLIVGANLLKGLKGSAIRPSILVGILTIRNIMLPGVGIGVVKAAEHFGLVGSYKFYQFTLLLQYSMPPAVNIGVISQMIGTGEGEFSVIMLWSYVASTISLTLWSTFYMWLVST